MSDHGKNDQHYRELISGYIDGDLTADERHELLRHLASCRECRQTLEAYRQIGSQLRSLPPPAPRPDLRDAIFAQTIDAGSRRLHLFASRVGYSMAALAAVALIFVVAIYLLVNGYQRTIDPEVIGSEPVSNVIWPLHKPIEITFNKAMDRDSVEAALSISPASEKERLTINWDGNTMIIGQNQSLKAGSSYSILITDDAEDEFGNNLDSEFRLQFQASETVSQIETPIPIVTPTPRPTLTAPPPPTATGEPGENQSQATAETPDADTSEPSPSVPGMSGDDQPPGEQDGPAPAPAGESSPTSPAGEPGEPEASPSEPPVIAPAPTATPTSPPEPTSTPQPTSTPEPAATATPTPTAAPPTPTEPLLPTATSTPDAIPVVGAFGNVYWGAELVQSRLGAPVAAAISVGATELDFQHGEMFRRGDTGTVFILESTTGVWSSVQDSENSVDPVAGPVEGTWEPGGTLGALWASEGWIQDALGFALAPQGNTFESRAQTFSNGTMLLSSSGQIYVLYSDGTWELYPDPGP